MRKMVEQMINSSKIHELITYSANVLLSILSPVNMRAIKVRKLLITAGVYESEVSEKVQDTFEEYRETQDYQEKNRKFMED